MIDKIEKVHIGVDVSREKLDIATSHPVSDLPKQVVNKGSRDKEVAAHPAKELPSGLRVQRPLQQAAAAPLLGV